MAGSVTAVTFDAGQTLIDLDTALLAARLAERGVHATEAALAAAAPAAWRRYDAAVAAGGGHPWRVLMAALLAGAGVARAPGHGEQGEPGEQGDQGLRDHGEPGELGDLVEWLWSEQPTRNLWRREVPGMFELARSLRRQGVAVAVLSNSEGRLAELFEEMGWAADFEVITDSGRVGVEKPDPRIFRLTLERLGHAAAGAVHIGDSWPADVEGAVGAGLRAIWFGRHAMASERTLDPARVGRAADAAGVARVLAGWGAGR